MALDASSERYILPFNKNSENQFHNLCKNTNVSGILSSDESKELLEIRITEIPEDIDDSAMLHSRSFTGNLANDFGSVMMHQEIDFESLNQIFSKDVVYMSSASSEDVKQSMGIESTTLSEVKNMNSLPVIMFSKDSLDSKLTSQPQGLTSQDLKFSSRQKIVKDVPDDFVVFNDEGNLLSSIQVLGVENLDQHVWIPDQFSETFPEVSDNQSNLLDPDVNKAYLVPVKLEDDVVFIDAAPSSTNIKNKEVLKSPSICMGQSESIGQERQSILSISVSNSEPCPVIQSQVKRDFKSLVHNVNINSSVSQVTSVQKGKSEFSQHTILPASSRSVLKSSFAKEGKKPVPLKPKLPGKQYFKEEHFSSLISHSVKPFSKNPGFVKKQTIVKSNAAKSQSLAVVAISSDKTKDITEIVVSTAKGEQIFKGKTSELISATPNLWRTNSVKSNDDASQSSESNALEDEEMVDDQPMTDALQRLGIPALGWIQNKPEDQRMWYCPEKGCQKLFHVLNQLKVHILGHYGVRPYKCDFPNCQWAFYTHFKLKRHKETHLQRKDFKCSVPECGRSFTTIYNLKTHQKLHRRPAEIMCPVDTCSELFQTRRSLEFHLKEHGTDHAPYVCPYSSCQKRYYSVNSVNSHIRSHQHKDDEIRCQWPGCTKVFTKPCRLRAHMRTHTGDKPYLCTHPGCTWAFPSSSKLRRHQFKHTNVRNFQCRIDGCGKLFMRSEHLKEHALTHSTERTFQCPHPNCNMKFSAKSSLYVHSKKHRAKVHAVPLESVADAVTSIPVRVIQSTGKISVGKSASDISSLPEVRSDPHMNLQGVSSDCATQPEMPEATQTLDFIPLLTEDEVLVGELANVEPVSFEHCSVESLGSADTSLPSQDMDTSSNLLSTLPGYMDDTGTPHNMSQVLVCSQELDTVHLPDVPEQDEDIGKVMNPGSARSSITIQSWTKFKRMRQSQVLPVRHVRQPRRHNQQPQKLKKQSLQLNNADVDPSLMSAAKPLSQEGMSNLRAPLDVVLGSGYLSANHDSIAHLLLPVRLDDLASSSDLYSSDDAILSMESSFVPSTINLRDLE